MLKKGNMNSVSIQNLIISNLKSQIALYTTYTDGIDFVSEDVQTLDKLEIREKELNGLLKLHKK
jgi:hypothetical protein